MTVVTACIAGFLAGYIGALGLGGGGVLVMFLTAFLGVSQLKAQGINLMFFVPIGLFALIWHIKKGLVRFKAAVPAIIAGLCGALLGAFLARFFGGQTIRTLFGLMLLALGVWELFAPHKKDKPKKSA